MRKMLGLNLADRMNGIYNTDATFGTALTRIKKESGYDRFERVYIGSYFCALYFIKSSDEMVKSLLLFCEKEHMKITLVLPIFAQRYLAAGKEKIAQILATASDYIDEITVNDFGMMEFIRNHYDVPMNLGRLFSKDYREKRYEEYFSQPLQPKMFNSCFLNLIHTYPVCGMELDATHKEIDLSKVLAQYQIGIHYPYCYQTVGQICESASTIKDLSHKFRPNSNCNQECEEMSIRYEDEEYGEYIKRGRSVFFLNRDCNITGRDEIRLIYSEAMG